MKKILLIAGLVSLTGTGCKKFLDINQNPNTPTVTQSNFVFANAVNRTAAYVAGGGGPFILGGTWDGMYGHSTSFTGGGEEKTYVFTNANFNYFDGPYDIMADYQYIVDNAPTDGFSYLIGPAKIMQVFLTQKLVDMYGNVPYSTSKAAGGTYTLTPTYDDAAGIYAALVTKLTDAVAQINADIAKFPSSDASDIMFNGSALNWKRFANTLKLRLIVRRSNVAGYNPAADIASISADGFITTSALSQPGYVKAVNQLNPFYSAFGFSENDGQTGDFRKVGDAIVSWLKQSSDMFRLSRLASAKADNGNALFSQNQADYAGVPLGGSGNPYLSANVSAPGRQQVKLGEFGRPVVIISDAEAAFLQAEAIQRGWLPGSAQAMYENGVKLAFRLAANTYLTGSTQAGGGVASATVAQADAASAVYLTSGLANADWNASPDKLKAIWVQKWVALMNMDGEEAWSEYRRTNSPTNPNGNLPGALTAKSVATTSSEPVRLFYPQRESNVNTANVPTGINVFTSRIFWDIN